MSVILAYSTHVEVISISLLPGYKVGFVQTIENLGTNLMSNSLTNILRVECHKCKKRRTSKNFFATNSKSIL